MPAWLGNRPQVEVGEGGVWVLVGPTVVHVGDPTDGTIVGTVSVGGTFVTAFDSIAVGSRTVWVGALPGIVGFNPATDGMLRPVVLFPLGVLQQSFVALGSGSAWGLTTGARVTRVVPQTGAIEGTQDVGQSASGLASGFDAVWIIDALQGTLTRVEPETLDLDAPIAVSGDLDAIASGAGFVWNSSTRASSSPSTRLRACRARRSVWVLARRTWRSGWAPCG